MNRWAVAAIFVVGLLLRAPAFTGAHQEGDEVIYRALVEQLEQGHGYTLRGHPLLERGELSRPIYGGALFVHPPAGPGLFWLAHRLFGQRGFALVQAAAYALFFASLMLLGRAVLRPWTPLAALLVATLAAANPIAVFVAGHHWLDGPLLALGTLAAALFLRSLAGRPALAVAAGLALGAAGLVKLTAVLVVPGIVVLALAVGDRRRVAAHAALLVGIAVLAVLPWILWQWRAGNAPFALAGRPPLELLRTNPFLDLVTRVRPPWAYLWLLPTVAWTALPSLTLLALYTREQPARAVGLALALWAAVVVGGHVVLGFLGYPRLLRYLVLAIPPLALLFVHGVGVMVRWRQSPDRRVLATAALGLAAAGLALELAHGVRTGLVDGDLVTPLFG